MSVLGRVLRKVAPREQFPEQGEVLVTFGPKAFYEVTGLGVPHRKARGYRFESDFGPVIPTLDLAEVAKGKMNLQPVLIWDLLFALEEVRLGKPEWPLEDLELYPTPSFFQSYCEQAARSEFVVLDLETESSMGDEEDLEEEGYDRLLSQRIWRASLSRADFKSVSFPWQEPFISSVRQLLLSGVSVVTWNGREFDLPIVRKTLDITPTGRHIDAMWYWRFLNPHLPKGLGFVTTMHDRVPEWKSLGSAGADPELYSAMDARETAKCWVGIAGALSKRFVGIKV